MIWCDTVPNPMCGSQRYGARESRRSGSRYKSCFVSAVTRPGDESRNGMYARSAKPSSSSRRYRSRPCRARPSPDSAAGGEVRSATCMKVGCYVQPQIRPRRDPGSRKVTGTIEAVGRSGTQFDADALDDPQSETVAETVADDRAIDGEPLEPKHTRTFLARTGLVVLLLVVAAIVSVVVHRV